jgi:tetratricopeptide (TPR) repeat protein
MLQAPTPVETSRFGALRTFSQRRSPDSLFQNSLLPKSSSPALLFTLLLLSLLTVGCASSSITRSEVDASSQPHTEKLSTQTNAHSTEKKSATTPESRDRDKERSPLASDLFDDEGAQREEGERSEVTPPTIDFDSEQFRHYFYDLLVAEMLLQNGDYESAITRYLALSRLLGDDELARYTAHIAMSHGRMEHALEAALNWLEISPDQFEARRAVAVLMLLNSDVEESARQFIAIIENYEDEKPEVFDEVIQLLMQDESRSVALDVVTLLAHHFESREPLWRLAAELSLNRNDPLRTEAFLQRAIDLGAPELWAEKARCRLLLLQGERSEAVIRYQMLVLSEPDNQALREDYADFLRSAAFYRAAREEYRVLLSIDPKNSIYRFWVAMISVALEESAQSLALFTELYDDGFRLFRDGFRAHDISYYAAQVLDQQRQYEEALVWYERVVLPDYFVTATLRRAELLALLGRDEEACGLVAQMRDNHPNLEVDLYLFEMNLLKERGQHAQALGLMGEAMQRHPEEQSLLYVRAMLYNDVDDINAAERDLRQLIERDENDAMALNALGYILADKTDRYHEAHEFLQRAIALAPDDPAIIDSVGWVYYKLGRFEEAERWIRRALERLDQAEIIYHLAQLLHDLGRIEESCELMKRGLEKDPHHVRMFILHRGCEMEGAR